jgi:2-keto-3-deoxy-L-rhamnonate aldolase RhmA
MIQGFRARVRDGEVVLGAFIKTAHHSVGEVMGRSGVDFAIIDAEHSPFDLDGIDRVVLGAQAADLPCLVRPAGHWLPFVGQCLDLGAAGILAPHVIDRATAMSLVSAAKYGSGGRGFSPATRAGDYGTVEFAPYRARADAESSLWCQIEDAAALEHLDEIAAVEGVDCLFLGRADLALSLGVEGPDHPKMREASQATAEAAKRNGCALGAYLGDIHEIEGFLDLGATVLVVGADQSWIVSQGRRISDALSEAMEARAKGT